MSEVRIADIVALVGGRYDGPPERLIRGVATLSEAREDHLSFLGNSLYAGELATTRAGAIVVAKDAEGDDPRFIRVAKPYVALADILTRWFDRPAERTISAHASIAAGATIGKNVSIGPFAAVGEDVVIGDDTTIHSNVSIYAGSRIGKRCIVHSGAVIGADGFGFAFDGRQHKKIPQIGIVRIEDDVEIGANSCVDRAALGETVVGEGTKIDNHVQIGHNCRIGKYCVIVAQVGIAGSTTLGDYVTVAGQAGLSGHLTVGDRAQIGAAASVFHDVPADGKVIGSPAIPFREYARRDVLLRRLLRKKD